jgi:hypothetical protein
MTDRRSTALCLVAPFLVAFARLTTLWAVVGGTASGRIVTGQNAPSPG